MNPLVRSLFHELSDLPAADREKFFSDHQIEPGLRAEVESLLALDSANDHSFTEGVSTAAADVLASSVPRESTHWGPYRQIRLIGTGGMGSVYLAERTDGEIQQKVAVKVLRSDSDRPAWRERFLKERQLLAYLNHPSIARLIDAGHTSDGRPYLVMEYVDGTSIDVYAAKMDLRDQLKLFLRVCEGVSHAHSHLIIHRDLKPSNILVDASGQPKLLDFGIAKLLDRTEDPTRTIDRLLTPSYASPEQLRGETQSTASDLYSLGAVLYKILTGRSPHESASGTLQAIEVVTGKRDIQLPSRLNPGLPSDIDYILRKALRNEPQERYASVEAFANDIRAFLDWRPVQARSGDAWYRTRKFARRYWVPLSAVLLLMAGLSVGLFVVNRERAIAQSRFQQVRQLSNRVLALDRVVSGLPGSTKTRTEIVAMSKEYLEGLGAEARSDPDLAVEIGAAYLSLAQVQGVPAGLNLGQYAQAEESLVKAESLIDGVLKTAPQNRKALATSAEISQSRMLLADADNRRDAAVTDGRKAVAQMDALIALGNMSRAEMDIAMRDFSNVSLIFKNAHLYDDSILYARRALEVSPSGTLHEIAASTLSIMADSMRYAGDLEGSLEAIRKAQTMAEGATYRSEAARARAMFGIIWREGEILGQDGQISLGRPDEATVAFQKSLDLMEDVAKADANDTSCRVLIAQAARELGAILSRRDPARALAVYDHGLRRIREFQNNAKARRDEARLLALSSYALRYLNRTGEARQRLDKALQLLRDTKTYPGDRIVLLSDTEIVLRAWGDYLAHSGRLQHALSVYQELLEKVMAAHPEPDADLSNATGISRIYEALATLHLRNGNAAESQSMSVARLNLWQHWARKLPENTYVKQQLEAAGRS